MPVMGDRTIKRSGIILGLRTRTVLTGVITACLAIVGVVGITASPASATVACSLHQETFDFDGVPSVQDSYGGWMTGLYWTKPADDTCGTGTYVQHLITGGPDEWMWVRYHTPTGTFTSKPVLVPGISDPATLYLLSSKPLPNWTVRLEMLIDTPYPTCGYTAGPCWANLRT
jgi:hypothetical protein